MENLKNLVNSEKNGFQKLIERIPGLGGAEKKENKREIDKIVRETVAARFEEQEKRVSAVERELAKGPGLVYLGELETAAMRMRRFAGKIRTAPYGYAGAMDAVKVDDVALSQMADYDEYLLSLTDTLRGGVDAVEDAARSGADLSLPVRELSDITQECITALDRRAEVRYGTQND